MGNSLRVVLDNYIGTAPIPCHLQLGETTSIDLSRDFEKEDAEVVKETFKVVYTVDKETCEVSFKRCGVDQHSNTEKVKFFVYDRSSSDFKTQFIMKITGTKYIRIVNMFWWLLSNPRKKECPTVSIKRNKSSDAWGGVVDTEVQLYENGRSWGLVVKETKKKRGEEEAEVATVAHYFVKSSGTDIGFSVVAKIGVSNEKFDVTVEGPEQHPVSALLYMFDQVYRTGTWKPTMCPHCDHKRKGKVFWQSDSEDSDSVSIPVPRATPRNARGVSNGGRFQGNGNGNFFENNVMIFPKGR